MILPSHRIWTEKSTQKFLKTEMVWQPYTKVHPDLVVLWHADLCKYAKS